MIEHLTFEDLRQAAKKAGVLGPRVWLRISGIAPTGKACRIEVGEFAAMWGPGVKPGDVIFIVSASAFRAAFPGSPVPARLILLGRKPAEPPEPMRYHLGSCFGAVTMGV